MSILSLPAHEHGFIILLNFISLTLISICLLINFVQPKHKKHFIATIVIFILNCLNLMCVLGLNKIRRHKIFDQISPIGSFINECPLLLQYIFLFLSIAFALYEFYIIFTFIRKRFSINVVRDSIENLPTGLAYYDESGFLYLSNRIMHRLSVELTQKDLQNGLELQNDVGSLQSGDMCVIKSEEPAFALSDSRIWQFSKANIEIEGRAYTELRADDITEIYHLSDEIRGINESLRSEKIRLAEHMKNIGRYISEEETLRVKMAVHDDFGELIARTVRAYERRANEEEKTELITAWSKLSQKMNSILTIDKRGRDSLEKVLTFAKELGCKIEIIGMLPDESIEREIILSATFESLKNAVYHAKAEEVIVTITNEHSKIITTIYNEDRTNPQSITEGGGLATLREKVEKAGGTMEIICKKGVTICIKLCKDVDKNV